MGRRGPSDPLEPKNNPKLIHGIHTFLPSLWSRSHVALRPRPRRTKGKSFRPRPSHGSSTRHSRPAQRSPRNNHIRFARYQQTLCRYHKRKIRGRILEVGDLVLRRTQSTKEKYKLSPPCEGPYTVTEVIRPGTYRLEDNNDNALNNTWNIEQLHRFFP